MVTLDIKCTFDDNLYVKIKNQNRTNLKNFRTNCELPTVFADKMSFFNFLLVKLSCSDQPHLGKIDES